MQKLYWPFLWNEALGHDYAVLVVKHDNDKKNYPTPLTP